MAKKSLVGVSNVAKLIPNKGYVGISNTAKKLIKGYVGDENGLARLFWDNSKGHTGQKLVFDYDYQAGQTYSVNRIGILDTIRYFISKTCYYNKGTSFETFYNGLESKIDEIIQYVQNELINTDNTVLCQADYTNSGTIVFYFYIGNSSTQNITVTSLNYAIGSYKTIYWDVSGESNSRMYVKIVYSGSELTKSKNNYQRNLGFLLGNYANVYTSLNYLNYVTNVGVHIEDYDSGKVVANWNFRSGSDRNIDSIEGLVACRRIIYGDSYFNSAGLNLAASDYLEIPSWVMHYANTIEMSFSSFSFNSTWGNLTWFNDNSVIFGYDETDGWYFQDYRQLGTNGKEKIGYQYPDLFILATFKMRYDSSGYITIYRNNQAIYTTKTVKMTERSKIGQPVGLCNGINAIIRSLKFYNS